MQKHHFLDRMQVDEEEDDYDDSYEGLVHFFFIRMKNVQSFAC
jgi:hypothetical protein